MVFIYASDTQQSQQAPETSWLYNNFNSPHLAEEQTPDGNPVVHEESHEIQDQHQSKGVGIQEKNCLKLLR